MGEVWQLVVEVIMPRSPPPPRVGTSGSPTTSPVGPKTRCRLRSSRKERNGFSSRSNYGRYRIGRKRNSFRKSRTRPRKWDPKIRKFRRTPRKYYGSCLGKRTRKVGGIKRIIERTSNLTGGDGSKGLGRCENGRSG